MLKVEPTSLRSAGGWPEISSQKSYFDSLYNKPEDRQLSKQSSSHENSYAKKKYLQHLKCG